jgi:hypothetical protein
MPMRNYVSGGSVVMAPPPWPPDARALLWQADVVVLPADTSRLCVALGR